jgi:CdiI immunity protein
MDGLHYLLASYFHEDSRHAHQPWEAVIDKFLTDNPARVAMAPVAIEHFLAAIADDAELECALRGMGMAYHPDEGDRVWLEAVRDRIINGLQPSEPRPTPGTTPERDSKASAASTDPGEPLEIEYPALWHFLGSYLHQDWQLEYTSPFLALEGLISHGKDAGFELVKDIDRLLAVCTTDVELETFLWDLGSYYRPSLRGEDPRAWLFQMRADALALDFQASAAEWRPRHNASAVLIHELVAEFPALRPVLIENLDDMDGELLPYLILPDVARWATQHWPSDPLVIADLCSWLDVRYVQGDGPLQDLIGLGFVEMLPATPVGDPLLDLLPPALNQVAHELGLFFPPEDPLNE